jgi:C4-type Zn-finger protein
MTNCSTCGGPMRWVENTYDLDYDNCEILVAVYECEECGRTDTENIENKFGEYE